MAAYSAALLDEKRRRPGDDLTTVLALQNLIGGARSGQFGIGPGATSITVPQ